MLFLRERAPAVDFSQDSLPDGLFVKVDSFMSRLNGFLDGFDFLNLPSDVDPGILLRQHRDRIQQWMVLSSDDTEVMAVW